MQQTNVTLTQGLTYAMYVRPPAENRDGFLASLSVYYDDIVMIEPALLTLYDDILPRLDRALAESN
jgi:hypothetical protein